MADKDLQQGWDWGLSSLRREFNKPGMAGAMMLDAMAKHEEALRQERDRLKAVLDELAGASSELLQWINRGGEASSWDLWQRLDEAIGKAQETTTHPTE